MATMVGLFCASLACFVIVTVAFVNQVAINRSVTDQRPVTSVVVPTSRVDQPPIGDQPQFQPSRVTVGGGLAPVTRATPITARKHPEPLRPSLPRQVEMFLDYCASDDIGSVASSDAVDMYFDMCVESNVLPYAKKTFLTALGKTVRKTQRRVDGERPRIYLLTQRVDEFTAMAA